jgi:hypothetical protein
VNNHLVSVDIAVRAYPEPPRAKRGERRNPGPASGIVVVLDTETRTDLTQRLLFGSYRVYAPDGRQVEEGLVAADDLTVHERQILEGYGRGTRSRGRLRVLSRREFVDSIVWRVLYKGRATFVGFNDFYDLSRLAIGWRPARGSTFGGGFSLILWPEYEGHMGATRTSIGRRFGSDRSTAVAH